MLSRAGAAAVGLVALAVAAWPAAAAVAAPATPGEVRRAVAPYRAIGRANYAGHARRRHCTMFAIAPRVALTAAHCLDGIAADRLHLLFGYGRMTWSAHLVPTRAVDLGGDIAALCLAQDAPAVLPTAEEPPVAGDVVRVVGYGRPRRHVLSEVSCTVRAVRGTAALLDCAPTPGASGAPVIDARGHAVALVTQSGAAGALAPLLPADAAPACR